MADNLVTEIVMDLVPDLLVKPGIPKPFPLLMLDDGSVVILDDESLVTLEK